MAHLRNLLWTAILLGILCTPAVAAGVDADPVLLPEHGFTLKARFTWDDSSPAREQGMWLVGASSASDASPSFLALAWSPVRDGWFGDVWGLQLVSDAGIFPSSLRAARSNSGLLAGTEYLSVAVQKPVAGHEYQATLGYSPATGSTGVEVTDLTTGRVIVRQSYELLASSVPLVPGRGIQPDADEKGEAISPALEIIWANLPLEVEWIVTQPSGGEDGLRSVMSLNRQRPAELHLRLPWASLSGELTLLLEDGSVRHQLLTITEPHDWLKHTVELTGIVPGKYDLVTLYTEGGETWEVARTPLRVGQIALGLTEVELAQGADGTLEVRGNVTISTDAAMTLPEIGVQVNLDRHDFALPNLVGSGHVTTSTVWQQEMVQQVESDEIAILPFALSLPLSLDAADAVWQLAVKPHAQPDTLLNRAPGTDIWLGKTGKPFSWQGLLEVSTERHMTIVPGVEMYWATGEIAAGPIDMFVLEVDLSQPGIQLDAMVGDRFFAPQEGWPRARVSEMVMRDGAVAGVNGAFYFLDTSLPRSMVLQNWQVLRSPGPPDNAVFGITDDGEAYIGLWEWEGEIRSESGESIPLSGINPRTHGRHGVVMYRSPWRVSPGNTSPDVDPLVDQVVELVVTDLAQAGPGRVVGRIIEILDGEPGILLSDGMAVISGRGTGAATLRDVFDVGETIEINYSLPAAEEWPWLPGVESLSAAVSGGVVLVKNGVYGGPHVTADTGRHPRAAVGVSSDRRTLYFLVADGRSSRSVGLTYKELADFFLHLGVYEALNLDSGGSSTLAVRPYGTDPARPINSPSDGSERFVADGIGIFYQPH